MLMIDEDERRVITCTRRASSMPMHLRVAGFSDRIMMMVLRMVPKRKEYLVFSSYFSGRFFFPDLLLNG